MRKYFGTDGIRRIANSELTPDLVYKVAKAGAYVLSKHIGHKPTILIGRDTRLSGTLIESAMLSGFLSYGANVKLLGVAPTPAVAYLTKKLKYDISVVISASHNTFEYNGIKFFNNNGMKISDEIEEEIEELMDSDRLNNILAEHHEIGVSEYREDLLDEYAYFFRKYFEDDFEEYDKDDFIVGIDAANGATYKVVEKIFKSLDIKYKLIFNNPDGININHDCGSTHLGNLKKLVKENKLSLGVAYDGDGDRCLAIDENGNELDGDKLLAIIAYNLKKKNKLNGDTIVATVMSNLGLNKYSKDNDFNLIQTKVGDRYVLEEMLKSGYNLGGEQSGHVIMSDYNPTGDGILTSIMLIKTILEEKKKASEMSDILKLYPQVLINAKVTNEKKYDYDKDEDIKNAIDTLTKEFEGNGRVLIRASGTEPLVRVMIEGEDLEYITKKANEIAELIKQKL